MGNIFTCCFKSEDDNEITPGIIDLDSLYNKNIYVQHHNSNEKFTYSDNNVWYI